MDLDLYRSLFVNRTDVFAEQQPSGIYLPVRRPLTNEDIQRHLNGEWSIGTYCIDPATQSVRNIVFDLDVLDDRAADTLSRLVEDMVQGVSSTGFCALLREFSGNKGTHVWLFLAEPAPAEKVRRWVAADFMPKWQEVAEHNGWPTALEVFPKQDTVPNDGYGNLVKLPFGVHRVSGARSHAVNYSVWPSDIDGVYPLEAELVPDREPVMPVRHGRTRRVWDDSDEDTHTQFACIDEIMHNGAPSGMRDNAMFHLALYCRGHGYTEDQALDTCMAANEKFDPPMQDREVELKVRHAWTGRYQSAGCGADWLANFCPGPCTEGWHASGKKARAGVLDGVKEGDAIEVNVASITTADGKKRVKLAHPDALNMPTLVVG